VVTNASTNSSIAPPGAANTIRKGALWELAVQPGGSGVATASADAEPTLPVRKRFAVLMAASSWPEPRRRVGGEFDAGGVVGFWGRF